MQPTESASSGQPNGKSIESATLCSAHVALRMCQVLRWLAPILICAAGIWVAMTHPRDIRDIIDSVDTWDALPIVMVILGGSAGAIAYSLWCSRLLTGIISSIEDKGDIEAGRLLRRYWVGVALFSGPLGLSGLSAPIIVALLAYVSIVLLPSTPVILVYLESMRRRNPSCPTWRIALTGIGLTIGTLLIAFLLGSLACVVLMMILWLMGSCFKLLVS